MGREYLNAHRSDVCAKGLAGPVLVGMLCSWVKVDSLSVFAESRMSWFRSDRLSMGGTNAIDGKNLAHFSIRMHAELTAAPRQVDGLAFSSRQASWYH